MINFTWMMIDEKAQSIEEETKAVSDAMSECALPEQTLVPGLAHLMYLLH